MAGFTDWVHWELKQIIAHNAQEKLIICFPPIGKRKWQSEALRDFSFNMTVRMTRVRRAFEGTPWEVALNEL